MTPPHRRSERLLFFAVLLLTCGVRLIWAAHAPMANDEAYYWDWSRHLQLSFLDHPPGVAWLGWLGGLVTGGALGARFAVVCVHALAAIGMLFSCELLNGGPLSRSKTLTLLCFTELVPVFSLEGLLLLPDSGLLAALAWALFAWLKAAGSAPGKATSWVLPAGTALGVAGLFKYHAAPIAIGMSVGLFCYWRAQGRVREWFLFSIGAAGVALLVTLPVWVWNAEHGWASLFFQGAHGFAGLKLTPLAALRVYLGQMLLLTPLLLISGVVLAGNTLLYRRPVTLGILGAAAFLPLFLLLEVLAFGKQMLPHWVAPALWMLVPAVALQRWPRWAWRSNLVFAVLVTGMLPWVLVVPSFRQALVDSREGRPGPLSELTLWEPLAASLNNDARLQAALRTDAGATAGPGCQAQPLLASLRWFWSAQLAFHLPQQPRVLSLDLNHPSFYSYRDRLADYAGCAVVVIGDERHLNREQLAKVMTIDDEWRLVVSSHQDTNVVMLHGRLKAAAQLEKVQLAVVQGRGAT